MKKNNSKSKSFKNIFFHEKKTSWTKFLKKFFFETKFTEKNSLRKNVWKLIFFTNSILQKISQKFFEKRIRILRIWSNYSLHARQDVPFPHFIKVHGHCSHTQHINSSVTFLLVFFYPRCSSWQVLSFHTRFPSLSLPSLTTLARSFSFYLIYETALRDRGLNFIKKFNGETQSLVRHALRLFLNHAEAWNEKRRKKWWDGGRSVVVKVCQIMSCSEWRIHRIPSCILRD